MRIPFGRPAACIVLGLASAVAAAAQAPAPAAPANEPLQPTPTFGERIEVRVVNVEVVVTDRQGNRVPGLTPADFRLKVDGKTVPIDYFTEVRGGSAIAPEEGAPTAVRGLPTLEPGAPVGTSYLVFVDDYFSVAANRDKVLRALKDDLARLGPDDRMAIVAFDGTRLDMLTSWTNSQRALGSAITEATRRPAFGLQRVAELNAFETGRNPFGGGLGGVSRGFDVTTQLDIEELSYTRRLADQIGRSVEAAASTLRGFASPPGRKVFLLLSGGWPYSPADFAVNNNNRPVIDREVPTGETLLRPLDDTANLLGYTVYPVDVQGLEQNSVDASRQLPLPQNALAVRDNEVRTTLLSVADQTGGKALLAGLRGSPLAAVEADTRSYYWIGFTPAFKKDDARHKVAVEVVGKTGFKVRTRQGYLDLSSRGEGAMMVESAMLFGNPPGATPLPIQLGAVKAVGRREIEVPLTVAIPVSAVTFVPLEGKYVAELEFRAAALDKDGNRSDVPLVPFKLTVPRQPEAGKYIPFRTSLRLRKIQQHLTVAILDPLSSKVLTTSADYNPKK